VKKTKGKINFNVIFVSELLKFISRLEFAKPLLTTYIFFHFYNGAEAS